MSLDNFNPNPGHSQVSISFKQRIEGSVAALSRLFRGWWPCLCLVRGKRSDVGIGKAEVVNDFVQVTPARTQELVRQSMAGSFMERDIAFGDSYMTFAGRKPQEDRLYGASGELLLRR